ncbi:MAG: RNase P subunit p30 family protein [Candidatus Bathyarchaeota archaeon]|jgi:ribonuclease P/MRP protein subunit RPP1
MKKQYADLHLTPHSENYAHKSIIGKAYDLGYRVIAISLPKSLSTSEINRLKRIGKENNVDFVTRVDLSARRPRELTKILSGLRRKFELIAVICDSKEVSRQAAKDHRVDLLNYPHFIHRKAFFSDAEARLASKASAALEIDYAPLLTLKGSKKIKLMSRLRREAMIARKFHVPIIVSSGASSELLMRRPREVVALTSLFDLDSYSATTAISESCTAIVKSNRQKLDPSYVAPGIKLIKRGKDC